MRDFGCKKADLSLKYRLGMEHALAKADFLNVPDLVTVQAFAIFLFLVRRYESPTFVWMMTGLVIRIAQALACTETVPISKTSPPTRLRFDEGFGGRCVHWTYEHHRTRVWTS